MSKIDYFNKNDLLCILKCRGLSPCIIYDKLVIFKGEKIVFSKKIDDLFINDLIDLGFDVSDSSYIYYLIDIARDNVEGRRKSLTL